MYLHLPSVTIEQGKIKERMQRSDNGGTRLERAGGTEGALMTLSASLVASDSLSEHDEDLYVQGKPINTLTGKGKGLRRLWLRKLCDTDRTATAIRAK